MNETWVKSPYITFIHDMVLTENWIVLILWPFEASMERMKAGGRLYAYDYDLPASSIPIPRRPEKDNAGWKLGEYRVYYTKNCMIGHTASGWEENGKIYFECSRSHNNFFPFFPAKSAVGQERIAPARGQRLLHVATTPQKEMAGLYTLDFEIPIAVTELPMRMRPQIHGNWVDARFFNDRPLVNEPDEVELSGKAINLTIDV
ncbi:hypothetical protein FSPOR_6780 [Fusarium sporotrichioides]|uniref:Uncharacterized protein n=1 Tax=Fusarium sporotrichioides TaxID=5514 RepID=A0A395S176_FUSSP|nr:hypothetical protein FSPOR_6780 [Fusarium sporotrichioides]